MGNKQIKILYDGTFIAENISPKSRTGIFIVAYNILKQMLKDDSVEIEFFCRHDLFGQLVKVLEELFPSQKFNIITDIQNPEILVKKNKLNEKKQRYKQEKRYFKKFIKQIQLMIVSLRIKFSKIMCLSSTFDKYDVFFSPMYKIPDCVAKNNNLLKFIILHDLVPLIYPDYFPNYENHWHKFLVESLNSRDYYFANSQYTKQDFLKYCPTIDPDKIVTTLLACDEKFNLQSNEKIKNVINKYSIPTDKKYIFSLCSIDPRKNLVRTVKTFIQFLEKNNIEDMVYVIGGGNWGGFLDIFEKEVENLGKYKDKILYIGYVDDEDLAPLYSGAEWFVYTSQYEGFGLPPLEAMSCGCPVITSNNSSLPEVVGDAGIMIDWNSDEQHIEAYEKYYFNPELRKQNSQKGLERAKMFSWEKCYDKMIRVIKDSLKK